MVKELRFYGTCVHKIPARSQMIPAHSLIACFRKVHTNIMFPSMFWSLTCSRLFRFSDYNLLRNIICFLFNCSDDCNPSLFCAGQQDTASSTTVRAVMLTSYMTSLVLFAGYSAYLVSSLTVQHATLPFTSLLGLLEDGSYSLGLIQNSAHLNVFDVMK